MRTTREIWFYRLVAPILLGLALAFGLRGSVVIENGGGDIGPTDNHRQTFAERIARGLADWLIDRSFEERQQPALSMPETNAEMIVRAVDAKGVEIVDHSQGW